MPLLIVLAFQNQKVRLFRLILYSVIIGRIIVSYILSIINKRKRIRRWKRYIRT
jgi:hypothetical protein